MRNIYDIITEQKSLADMNISSYDLNYTISHMSKYQDNYYIQEGIGESIKNIGKKVVDIIKTIIRKIKELINNVIGFFKKTDNEAEKLDKQIKDAVNGADSSDDTKKEEKKDEEEKEEEKPTKGQLKADEVKAKLSQRANEEKPKADKENIKSTAGSVADRIKSKKESEPKESEYDRKLKASLRADEVRRNMEKRKREKMTTHYGGDMSIHGLMDVLKQSDSKVRIPNFPNIYKFTSLIYDIVDAIEDKLADKINDENYKLSDLNNFIQNETKYNEVEERLTFETTEVEVKKIAMRIDKYVRHGQREVDDLKALEKSVEDNLNKMIRRVENNKEFNERAEALVTRAANVTGNIANKFIRVIGQIRSVCISIARKETNAFCNTVKQKNN